MHITAIMLSVPAIEFRQAAKTVFAEILSMVSDKLLLSSKRMLSFCESSIDHRYQSFLYLLHSKAIRASTAESHDDLLVLVSDWKHWIQPPLRRTCMNIMKTLPMLTGLHPMAIRLFCRKLSGQIMRRCTIKKIIRIHTGHLAWRIIWRAKRTSP